MATVDELEAHLREEAARYASGASTVRDLWGGLFRDLHGLCGDGPLAGPRLDLFDALERWEASVGAEREAIELELRPVAAAVAESPGRPSDPF